MGPFLCPLMNKSTLELANQAVATINLKGSIIKESNFNGAHNFSLPLSTKTAAISKRVLSIDRIKQMRLQNKSICKFMT